MTTRTRGNAPSLFPSDPTTASFPTDAAGRANWLLSGPAEELGARFDALADVALAEQIDATAQARTMATESSAAVGAAASAVQAAEGRVIRERSPVAQTELDAARRALDTAREVARLAERAVGAATAALAEARTRLAADMFRAANLGDNFERETIRPAVEAACSLVTEARRLRLHLSEASAAERARFDMAAQIAVMAGQRSYLAGPSDLDTIERVSRAVRDRFGDVGEFLNLYRDP